MRGRSTGRLRTRRELLRDALASGGAALLAGQAPFLLRAQQPRPKLPVAGVVTVYRENSHADVILGKILEGWKQDGGPGPDLQLVSLYTDQVPEQDLSRGLAQKHGFRIAPTVDEAVTLGTDRVAVEGVIIVGEHGNYPETPDTHQVMYPRRRMFDEVAAAFRRGGAVKPVFSDKHLSYNWADARHMADTAREMAMPFMAGSSGPVAWRAPPLWFEKGCRLDEAFSLAYGPHEHYGFHALELLQCMVERRGSGETGVASVEALQGTAIWEAASAGRWSRRLLDAALATTPHPKPGRAEDLLTEDAAFYLIEYRDGLKATMAMANGLTDQFAFAALPSGAADPAATWLVLQEDKPFGHFEMLLRAIEHMIHTGRPAYPVERTLLTSGILDAAMHSLAERRKVETPELAVAYEPADWPFAEGLPPGVSLPAKSG